MHRTISIKHRIVRRVDIDKAPLATFDTVDLGDEDVQLAGHHPESYKSESVSVDNKTSSQLLESNKIGVFVKDGSLKSETIGGNNSKKSLSQAGGEEKESKNGQAKDKSGCSEVENVQETVQSKVAAAEPLSSEPKKPETKPTETAAQKTDIVASNKEGSVEKDLPKTSFPPSLTRQGTIGRVNIPIKKQDSDSSSSSPGSSNEASFSFQSSHPSVGHFGRTNAEGQSQDSDERREGLDNLMPEYLDPSQILSPSKRKAYERRIERLKVTTSPIARPRSTAPINVVTLDEYAAISSPEPSPATPCVVQDKLKITLPTDEFTARPKTPKLHSARKHDSEDTCFEFAEDCLFSRTKSALIVSDDGQLPLSPRRILIPPNLTPTTSPKLSASPRLSSDYFHEDLATDAPKLIYIQHSEAADNFFGITVDKSEEENWANFSDCFQGDETVDHDTSTSTVCDADEKDLYGSLAGEGIEWTPATISETAPAESATCQPDNKQEPEEKILVHDFASRTEIISSHSDQNGINLQETSNDVKFDDNNYHSLLYQSETCSGHETLYSATQTTEVPHIELYPDFESEEILTIEINQASTGSEKHIGIEIKSRGSSASVSPVCFDRSAPLWSPDSENPFLVSHETHAIQPDSLVLFDPRADNSVLLSGTTSVNTSGVASSFHEDQHCPAGSECQMSTEQSLQVQKTQGHISSPFGDKALIPSVPNLQTVAHHQQQVNPHRPHQSPLSDQMPDLRQRPPSTNPFDTDYEPPGADPFELQIQKRNTNPFVEHSSIASSDLLSFSSSLDSSSA